MEIHELNTFSGTPGSGDYLATDNGNDTSKIPITDITGPLNARINNIIAGGDAPSEAEIVDARLGADGVTYPSLGDAIRGQVSDLKSDKADVAYSENTTDETLTVVNGSAWDTTVGLPTALNNRARSNQIRVTSRMVGLLLSSDYKMTVFGNNNGEGHSMTAASDYWVNDFDLSEHTYAYYYVLIKRNDGGVITGDDLSSALKLSKYASVVPYATKLDNDKKLNGRYGEDSTSSQSYLIGEHGAFDPSAGMVNTDTSLFGNRVAVAPFERLNSYKSISVPSGYGLTLYGNDDGEGSAFSVASDYWVQEADVSNVDYKYIAITAKKQDNSDLTNKDISAFFSLTDYTSFAKYLTKEEIIELAGENEWSGKTILWLGTSIPEQGYPQIVGTMIGAAVTNNAVGSSMMRIGSTNYDNSPLGDDLGITGMSHLNVLRSLSMTQAERLRLFQCWKTDDRKAYLMAQGYSASEVANVIGYSEMLTGSFPEEDTDPGAGQIPTTKPIDVFAGDGATYKDMRKYSYGCCWDDSNNIESGLSISTKVTGEIKGKLKSYVASNDWIFFDHFRNDVIDATSELYLSIPDDKYDRHYAIGAFNYLIQQIYYINPNANVLIIGHYDNDDLRSQLGYVWKAQEKASNLWAIPVYKLWEESGIRALTQFTTNGYWDSSHVWHDTGYNGSNSVMNNLENLNENKRQINGTWYHDVSLRQKWMWDDIHPLTADCKNHIAKLITAWLKTKGADMDR